MSLVIKDPAAIRKRRIKMGIVAAVIISSLVIVNVSIAITQAPVIFRFSDEENEVFPVLNKEEFIVDLPDNTESASLQLIYLLETGEEFRSVQLHWFIFSCNRSVVNAGFDPENVTSVEEYMLNYGVASDIVNTDQYQSPLFDIEEGEYTWVHWIESRPSLTWSAYISLSLFY
ncbi:MAG: hypothetical protein RTU92_11545 [Candidatus Thorarchaeota archaeon]